MANPVAQKQYTFNHHIIKKTDPGQSEAYDCTYSPYQKHRDGTGSKSQWKAIITEDIEFRLFKEALQNDWVRQESFKYKNKKYSRLLSPNGRGWGLYVVNNSLEELGVLENRKISVRVCIFEEGNAKLWHGYPADFKKPQDKPLDHVLKKWHDAKFITKATMSKIKGGKIKSL